MYAFAMKSGDKSKISPAFIAILLIAIVAALSWFLWGSTIKTNGSSGNSPGPVSGPVSGPVQSLDPNSQIPEPVASAQSQDQQAQADALRAEQEKAAAQAQQNQQLEQAPTRFECQVTGMRIGENRSLLRVSVTAPNEIPEVWVSINTERGNLDGRILLTAGSGEQMVPLRDPSPEFRPTIKVYSLPVLTEQYEMCSFR